VSPPPAHVLREALLPGPLGLMQLVVGHEGLCLLRFLDPPGAESQAEAGRRDAARWMGLPVEPGGHPLLDAARHQLDRYFQGRLPRFDLPLALRGTPFQQRVWTALLHIPHGSTQSYAQLAASVGSPGGSRAAGQANGRNPVALVVPCHRVIQASGNLGGFSAGLWRKQWLLDLERNGAPPPTPCAS